VLTNIFVVTNLDLSFSTNGSSGVITHTGGSLKIINLGPNLQVNDRFVLFSQPVPTGNLMPIVSPGFTVTNNLAVDGSVSVTAVAQPPAPSITKVTRSGGTNIVINGTNNFGPGGSFSLVATNNLLAPVANWPVVSTGIFNVNGNIAITNPIGTNLQFFILRNP
jgi:hypothetical protein